MPVAGLEKFYGRKNILDLLRKRVLDFKDGYRQNVALLGDRYIGKTFLLHKFLSEVASPDLIQIYINTEHKDIDYFCHRIAGVLLYEFSKVRKRPLHEDLNLLIESTNGLIPQTTASIQKMQCYLKAGRKLDAYKEAIALPQTFSSETKLFCLFVFDEFHCLEEWGVSGIFQELGKVIMTQKQSLYVFASSSSEKAQMILSEKLSLLFGNFEIVRLDAFELKTCQEYVTQHLPRLSIADDLKDFLIDFTGGHPLYLRLLCEDLVRLAAIHQQKEIFLPLLLRAVEDILFDPWGVLTRHFDLIIHHLCFGKGNAVHADILVYLSGGKQRVKDLAQQMGLKQSYLSPRLNRLLGRGVIAKNSKSFYICDRLLKYWLCYVFRPRREAIEINPEHRREQFRDEFTASMEGFRLQSKKEISKRIMDLLHCFDDESFQMDGRRYRLPVFNRISTEKLLSQEQPRFDVIKASTAGGDWAVLLHAAQVTEQELAHMIEMVKKRFGKPKRCVLISLNELDETVRVRALQEHMWIWNEREIRALLHIYDKPYIVV